MKIAQNKTTARKVAAKRGFKLTGLKSILDIRLGSTQLEIIGTEGDGVYVSKSLMRSFINTLTLTQSWYPGWGQWWCSYDAQSYIRQAQAWLWSWMQKKEKGERGCRWRGNARVCGCVSKKSQVKPWTKWTRFIYPINYKAVTQRDTRRTGIHNNEWATDSFVRSLCVPSIFLLNQIKPFPLLYFHPPLHRVNCCHRQYTTCQN